MSWASFEGPSKFIDHKMRFSRKFKFLLWIHFGHTFGLKFGLKSTWHENRVHYCHLKKKLTLEPQGVGFYGHRKNLDPKNQKWAKSLSRENRDNREFGANFSGGHKIGSLGDRDLIFFWNVNNGLYFHAIWFLNPFCWILGPFFSDKVHRWLCPPGHLSNFQSLGWIRLRHLQEFIWDPRHHLAHLIFFLSASQRKTLNFV